MAIAGIENLATGFLQGLNARKQQERQDVIDQRETERFEMQKQQFTDQQAANALSMKTNQFQLNQEQAKADRDKILQEKEDNFRKQWEGFARPFAMGNDQEGYNALEKTYNDIGYMGKGAFRRDAKGNVLLDDKGNITFLTYGADGKPVSKSLNKDKMIEGFINSYDPIKHWEHEQKTKAEIDKEQRQYNNEVKLSGVQTDNAIRLKKETERYTPRSLIFKESPTGTYGIDPVTGKTISVLTPDGLPIISSTTEKEMSPVALSMFDKKETVTEKYGGGTKQITTRDEQGLQDFMAWADENNKPLTVRSVGQWKNANKKNKPVTTETESPQSNQQKLTVNQWIKNRNITTKEQLSSAIAELRKSNPTWSNQQLKRAFVNAGVIE